MDHEVIKTDYKRCEERKMSPSSDFSVNGDNHQCGGSNGIFFNEAEFCVVFF